MYVSFGTNSKGELNNVKMVFKVQIDKLTMVRMTMMTVVMMMMLVTGRRNRRGKRTRKRGGKGGGGRGGEVVSTRKRVASMTLQKH